MSRDGLILFLREFPSLGERVEAAGVRGKVRGGSKDKELRGKGKGVMKGGFTATMESKNDENKHGGEVEGVKVKGMEVKRV